MMVCLMTHLMQLHWLTPKRVQQNAAPSSRVY